mmetsp:Transcript_32656/g.89367  ORF Transcript_32656/g.89367 Transcript_32656/m.89367 type:complete len:212 (+) Transcript_32656:1049-1684(+)
MRGDLRMHRWRSSSWSDDAPMPTIVAVAPAPRPSQPATESHCRARSGHRCLSPSCVSFGTASICSCRSDGRRESCASVASVSDAQPEMLRAVREPRAARWRKAASVTPAAHEMSRRTASGCFASSGSHTSPPRSESGAKLGISSWSSAQSCSWRKVSVVSQARESRQPSTHCASSLGSRSCVNDSMCSLMQRMESSTSGNGVLPISTRSKA